MKQVATILMLVALNGALEAYLPKTVKAPRRSPSRFSRRCGNSAKGPTNRLLCRRGGMRLNRK
jgi:hypothetical protein